MHQTLTLLEKVDILSKAKIFRSVSYPSLEHIASLTDQSLYQDKEAICEIGDPANHVCVIASGRVSVSDALHKETRTMKTGEIFGEYGMFNQGRRTANLKSIGETLVLTIHYNQFKSFLSSDASACLAILKETVERLLEAETSNKK